VAFAKPKSSSFRLLSFVRKIFRLQVVMNDAELVGDMRATGKFD
jgi:hypothetical protein